MKKIALLFIPLVILSACDSVKVMSDYDKTVDFTEYKTASFYGWAEKSGNLINQFDKNRIEESFTKEFTNRGITLVKENADIIVSLHIVTQEKTETTTSTNYVGGSVGGFYGHRGYGGYYGYGPGWGWGGGYATTTQYSHNYKVGTLTVSVFDANKKQLIWESAASGTLEPDSRKREHKTPRVVAYMMKKYPVKPSKK